MLSLMQEISDLRDQLKAAATKNRELEAQGAEMLACLKEFNIAVCFVTEMRRGSENAFAEGMKRYAKICSSTTLGAKLLEEVARMERMEGQLVDERDAAEETIGQIYYLILGHSPEWSNFFGHKEAIEKIMEVVNLLKQSAKELTTTQQKLAAALDIASKLVEYSNPRITKVTAYAETVQKLTAVLKDSDASGDKL